MTDVPDISTLEQNLICLDLKDIYQYFSFVKHLLGFFGCSMILYWCEETLFGLKSKICRHFYFLDVWYRYLYLYTYIFMNVYLYLYLECSVVHWAESVAHLGSVILMYFYLYLYLCLYLYINMCNCVWICIFIWSALRRVSGALRKCHLNGADPLLMIQHRAPVHKILI